MEFVEYDVDFDYTSRPRPHTDVLSNYKCVLLANYPINSTNYPWYYYSLWLLNLNPLYPTNEFIPLFHVSYQLSNVILIVYVIVCKKSVLSFLLLSVYALISGFWGLIILKSLDVCVWNCLLLCVVLIRLCASCCCGGSGGVRTASVRGRKVKSIGNGRGIISSGSSFGISKNNHENDLTDVFLRLFAPVRVSWKQFSKIIGCKRGIRVLGCGEYYSIEKRTHVDSLGLLLSGRLVVCQGGKPLHVILPFQFVDSPEYFGVATDELFQVTITALEESKVLTWHRDKIRLVVMHDEFLNTIFQHILARDVCRKLISVSDTIVTTPTTTTYTSNTPNTQISASPPPSNGSSISSSSPAAPPGPHKSKYSYNPTYLTSLSEEKNGFKITDEEEEGIAEMESLAHGDEIPMLDESSSLK